jgi:hypothetical protein
VPNRDAIRVKIWGRTISLMCVVGPDTLRSDLQCRAEFGRNPLERRPTLLEGYRQFVEFHPIETSRIPAQGGIPIGTHLGEDGRDHLR